MRQAADEDKAVRNAATKKRLRSLLYCLAWASSTRSSSNTTPYPAPSTAPARSAEPTRAGSYSTVAFSAAKFTLAARTPAVPERAFSSRRAHAAHVIPETGRETLRKSSLIPKIFDSPIQLTIPPYPIQEVRQVHDCIRYVSSSPAARRSGCLAGDLVVWVVMVAVYSFPRSPEGL